MERVEKNIRYAPLEFDGWRERHWTLPFKGERFSLVWFTPLTVAAPVPKPPLPPFVLEACKGDLPAPPSLQPTIERLAPGCVLVRNFLDVARQRDVVAQGRRPGLRSRRARVRRRRRAQVPDGVPRGSGLGPRVECLRRDGRRRAAGLAAVARATPPRRRRRRKPYRPSADVVGNERASTATTEFEAALARGVPP